MPFQDLQTDRLVLRLLRPDDAEDVFRYRSDPEISRYQSWDPERVSEVAQFIEQMVATELDTPGTWFQLAICARESDELVGDLGLHFPEGHDHEVEIGVTLASQHHGRGFATEALRAAFGFVFDSLGKHRVFGSVDPRNTASLRMMERVGMRREAHFRESLWFKGEWADDVIYAMLRREWSQNATDRRQTGG